MEMQASNAALRETDDVETTTCNQVECYGSSNASVCRPWKWHRHQPVTWHPPGLQNIQFQSEHLICRICPRQVRQRDEQAHNALAGRLEQRTRNSESLQTVTPI